MIFMAMIMLMTVMMAACSTEEIESKIDGEWSGKYTETDADGSQFSIHIYFEFSKADYLFRMNLGLVDPEVGRIGSIRCSGSWKVKDDAIVLDVDNETVKFKFDESLDELAQMFGLSINMLERELKKEIQSEMENMTIIPIESVTQTSMTLEIDGEEVSFSRPGPPEVD